MPRSKKSGLGVKTRRERRSLHRAMSNAVSGLAGETRFEAGSWELQGWQLAVYKSEFGPDGQKERVIDHLELLKPGKLSPAEYDRQVRDLVAVLASMGGPR